MRVTQNQFYQLAISSIQKNALDLFKAQQKVSTQKKVLQPSDDPSGTRRILSLSANLDQVRGYSANLDYSKGVLDMATVALDEINRLLAEVRASAIAGASGTATPEDRRSHAQVIDNALEQLEGLVNTQYNGQYLFGGTRNSSAPFLFGEASGGIAEYVGDRAEIRAAVGPGLRIALNIPGSDLFLSRTSMSPRFTGPTGVAPGSSRSTIAEAASLLLEHVATTLGDGALPGGGDSLSGVAPGASSAAGDSLLGSHELTLAVNVDGTGGTVSLGDGQAVSFTIADTDLRVENQSGDAIYLDLSGVIPGFSGNVDVSASGTYSLDGGATSVAIDFADTDQELIDPATGERLYVDGTGIRRTGTATILLFGKADLFDTLAALRDDLLNPDGHPSQEVTDRIRAHVEDLDRHHQKVLSGVTGLGTRSASLDDVRTYLEQLDLEIQRARSSIQDADLSASLVELLQFQTALEAAQAMAGKVITSSVMDYLR